MIQGPEKDLQIFSAAGESSVLAAAQNFMSEGLILDYALKALEWTKEWNTWLVGIDTAIIGGLIALAFKEKDTSQPIQFHSTGSLKITLGLFAISIGVATFTLRGIPVQATGHGPHCP